MKARKLNYRFHNPNPAVETANYLLKILIEANKDKVQLAIQKASKAACDTDEKVKVGHSAV